MICSRASSRAPDWFPMSRSWRNFRRATTSPRRASIAGPAAIGSCCRGFSGAERPTTDKSRHRGDSRDRPLEDDRQSAPLAFAAGGVCRFAGGWTLPLAAAEVWTALSCWRSRRRRFSLSSSASCREPLGISRWSRVRAVGLGHQGCVAADRAPVTLLPHQAWLMTDAIVRTLFRLFVSHRMLLEWITAAQAKSARGSICSDSIGKWRAPSRSLVGAMLLVAWVRPSSWPLALPFVALWLLSPAVARWVSLPPAASIGRRLADPQRQMLRLIARRTWRFFETFVTPADHMLPPDNFQEDPAPVLAHRTSPTNLGLYLFSVVAARDFGWIGTVDATSGSRRRSSR